MRTLDDAQLTSLEETCREYEMTLMESEAAASYLRGRGLSTACVDRFRLGVVPADPVPEHKGVAGRLAIPTLKRAGVVGFKFRCIDPACLAGGEDDERHEGHGKYQTFEKQALFNVGALDTDRGWIAVTEGEIDAITLDGECDIPAVGIVGVKAWKAHYGRLLKDFSRIWVFEDNDPSGIGQEFGAFVCDKFDHAARVTLPTVVEGKKSDVNRVFRAFGRDYVRGLIGL